MPDKLYVGKQCIYDRDTYVTQCNNNLLVIGSSGTGKTRHVARPNLMQSHNTSYIVIDPKGTLYDECRETMLASGYKVQKLNFANPDDASSCHWNPFAAILTDVDVTSMAYGLTFADGSVTSDRYWDEANVLLFSALIEYLRRYCTAESFTLSSLIKLLNCGDADGDNDEKTAVLDHLIDNVRIKDPSSSVVRMYDAARTARGRTWSSVLSTACAKVSIYGTDTMNQFLASDDKALNIAMSGYERTALFVIVSDTDRSLDSLINLFISQLIRQLVTVADGRGNHRLPVDVMLLLDDFANNATIRDFPRIVSSVRSRGISVMILIQDITQLYARYGSEGHTIAASCDTLCYLGGMDMDTASLIARRAGVTEAEVLSMPIGRMWVFRRGCQPVLTERLPV